MQFLIAVWCLNLGAERSGFFLRDSTRDIDGVGYVGLDMLSITYLIILDLKSCVIYVHMFDRTSIELEAQEMLKAGAGQTSWKIRSRSRRFRTPLTMGKNRSGTCKTDRHFFKGYSKGKVPKLDWMDFLLGGFN